MKLFSGNTFENCTKFGLTIAILIWITFIILISNGVFQHENLDKNSNREHALRCDELKAQINQLLIEHRALQRENEHLKKEVTIKDVGGEENSNIEDVKVANKPGILYTKEHEVQRRYLDNLIWETFYYLNSQMDILNSNKVISDKFINYTNEQFVALLAQSANFGTLIDKADKWHRRSLAKLTKLIQNKINRLQHPKDCSKTKILLCDLNKGCGFGCQLHHVTYCLVMAMAANRTMIMERDGSEWRYSNNGWNSVFLPITNCSVTSVIKSNNLDDNIESWRSIKQKSRVVRLPIVDALFSRPEQLPLSFPSQLADALLTHHSNPPLFFVSQFLWYLMQENTKMKNIISKAEAAIPFNKGPIVGLQIRRTDKVGTEAAFHGVEEYMKWADLFFRIQERRQNTTLQRRVFVATDDPKAVEQIKEKYQNFEVYFIKGIAETAQLSNRYSDASLYGVITDIRLLSKCSYLVCTFSSQVCRMGYELMQILKGDAADNFHSLDDIYYFGGQSGHDQVAVYSYNARDKNEIDLLPGDIIGVAGNHWNGYSMGLNRRTGRSGLYPSARITQEKWRIVDFPIFDEQN